MPTVRTVLRGLLADEQPDRCYMLHVDEFLWPLRYILRERPQQVRLGAKAQYRSETTKQRPLLRGIIIAGQQYYEVLMTGTKGHLQPLRRSW